MIDLNEQKLYDIIKNYIPDLTQTEEFDFSDAYSVFFNTKILFKFMVLLFIFEVNKLFVKFLF